MTARQTVGFLAGGERPQCELPAAFASALKHAACGNVEVLCGYAPRGDCYIGTVSELLHRGAQVLVASNTQAAQAALRLTDTVPIVLLAGGDPCHTGLVADTVVTVCPRSSDLASDRVRWLRWAFPVSDRIAVLWNPRNPAKMLEFDAVAAAAFDAELQDLAVVEPGQVAGRFAELDADVLIVLGDYLTSQSCARIIRGAAERKVPAMYSSPHMAEAGGLIAYGPDPFDACRRGAACVAQLLAGTAPADLTVHLAQPELVVNRQTERWCAAFQVNSAVRGQARLVA